MRLVAPLTLLAAALVAAPALAPSAQAWAPPVVPCTMTLAGDQYFATGDWLFVHGQAKDYAGDTVDNGDAYADCMNLTVDPSCEFALVGDQYADTESYLVHGQLKDYAGDSEDNARAYVTCIITV